MKKFLFAFSVLFMVACSDSDTTDDLQAQITELEATIEELRGTISSLSTANGTLQSRIQQAEDDIDAAQALITSLRGDVTTTQSSLTAAVSANSAAEDTIADLQRRLNLALAAIDDASYSEAVNLGATGSVAEQTPAQAKQTIYGRWDIPNAAKGAVSCSFDFFEFNDDNYLLSIITPDGTPAQVFGEYVVNEGADGTVENVQLLYNDNGNVDAIATLTNIVVVEETEDVFTATFDIQLELPEALEVCQPTLQGQVSAGKDDPVDEVDTATAISNHSRLIGEWEVVGFTENSEDVYDEILSYSCIEYTYDETTGVGTETRIDGCVPPVKYVINFSDYGTYMLAALRADGSAAQVEVNEWFWESEPDADTPYLAIVFQDEETGGTDTEVNEVVEISFDRLILSSTFTDYEYREVLDQDGNVIDFEERPYEVTQRITLRKN